MNELKCVHQTSNASNRQTSLFYSHLEKKEEIEIERERGGEFYCKKQTVSLIFLLTN